ncbi:hypothetical protein Tco_0105973 [Tanacetum coccineum]
MTPPSRHQLHATTTVQPATGYAVDDDPFEARGPSPSAIPSPIGVDGSLDIFGIDVQVNVAKHIEYLVGDEAVHKELGDRMERAATTASSLEAEQDSGSGPRCQDTILGDVNAQTRFEITSIQSIDPPLSRGYTLGSGEDSMKLIGIDGILYTNGHNKNRRVSWLKLVLSVLLSAVKHMLMLPVQVSAVEGDSINTLIKGFIYFFIRFHLFKRSLTINPNSSFPSFEHEFIILSSHKASSVSYALTVNPVIYTSCIEQFWATAKVQTVNGVRQIQALVDKKRVIVTESSIRRDLHLNDAEGTDCLPTATIFEELARMGYEKPS